MGEVWVFRKSGNMMKEMYFYIPSGLTALKATEPFCSLLRSLGSVFFNSLNKCSASFFFHLLIDVVLE
jgi:hypothetical protein